MIRAYLSHKSWAVILLAAFAVLYVKSCPAQDIRIAIVGTDSSHATEFTRILNDTSAPDHLLGAKIVAAFRGGNSSLALSRNRIERFSAELSSKWSIPFVSSIRELCSKADGILILSVDPTSRVREFEQAADCHKPIFVDKPAAASVQDLQQISTISMRLGAPWFSASALRFMISNLAGDVASADVWGPGELGKLEEGYSLDLAWYGVHSIEAISSAMGPGMAKISRVHSENSDIITIIWSDGRTGIVHLIRPEAKFTMRYTLSSGETKYADLKTDYVPLLSAIVTFFKTGVAPVSSKQTLEIFAAMHAAQQSMNRNGSLALLEVNATPRIKSHH